jgi:hypothetical protein
VSRQNYWVAPGQSVRVAEFDIPGGMIYVGQHLPSSVGTIEPALINPALPLGRPGPDRSGHDLDPAPSYHLISPASRAAYLAWLAGGRSAGVPVGFVSLFFSGLERRVLVDAADDPAVRHELPAIATEVRRLRALHVPASNSFDSYARAFLDVLELLSGPRWQPGGSPPSGPPPALHADRWPVPIALRVAIAGFAVTGRPVPADWARSWAWYHPSLFPRTPQTRCPQEFERLFAVRYARRFAAGLVPQATARPPIRIGYSPASTGIDAVVLDRPDLPDVLEEPIATRELGALVDSVTDALTPYSRWLARTPGGLGSLASTALLPAELLDLDGGPLRNLLTWANAHLDGQFAAVIDASEFSAFWSTANPAGMSRDESASLALILARAGLGVEPDVRFGGPTLAAGPAVLFRLDREAGDAPSPGYLAATTMLHLAAAVALATGQGSTPADRTGVRQEGSRSRLDPEQSTANDARSDPVDNTNAIITGLAAEVRLSVTERSRLAARLRWLFASGTALTRPDRRISALTATEREAAAYFLISVAAAGPVIAPETVTALTRAYRLLGLNPDLVYRRLHQRSVGQGGADPSGHGLVPADGPVVVRRVRPGPPGHPLPRTAPVESTASTESAPGVCPDAASRVQLSQEVITRKMTETAAVSTLLASIFTDEGAVAGAPAASHSEAGQGRRGGLDQAHSRLLGELATRSSWSSADFAELAAKHGVMPSGALDVINEVAMEIAGEPVVEGDDELTVNGDALEELLA